MLPVAAGAKGQPPIPPRLASMTVTPASRAATTLANPVLRVLWKWARSRTPSPTASRTAPTRSVTSGGTAAPMLSASAISAGPLSAASAAVSATRSTGTSPS